MKIIIVFLLFCLSAALQAPAEIIIKQDKDGNLTITNDYVRSPGKRNLRTTKPTDFNFIKSTSPKVPEIYLTKIRLLSRKYDVKEKLIIAVARAESGFNPYAVSKKGAVGIMQLMVETAREYGVVNRYNADQNMDAGVRYLKNLLKRYSGKLPLVLAAYNAGPEAVKKYSGIPPYKETKDYVRRVMRYMGMSYTGGYDYAQSASPKIYQYRTKDGKIMITDHFPANVDRSSITVIE